MMKENMRSVYFLLLSFFFISCSSGRKVTTSEVSFADNIVVAHRGGWKKNKLPENSIASLKEAIRLKCTGSEFDVRMTIDDSLIINHDPHYNKLLIEESTYAELEKFTLSNGEKLPTLREYILAGIKNNTTTRLVCEIKPSAAKERGKIIAEKVYRLINGLHAQHMVGYISFDYDILKKLVEINPSLSTQYLEGNKSPEQVKADGITGVDYHFNFFKTHPEWIKSAKKNNITLNVWTVNSVEDMDWLIANEFDFITTNEPELLFERIKKNPTAAGWKLKWSEEFNYKGLPDSSIWNYAEGGNGYGNNELQYYTKADTNNAIVKNGKLFITALKQTRENNKYTSARLFTKDKAEFMYGRIEVSAKLPAGKGTWPAIWMLGKNRSEINWPDCGEIDIMEHVGYDRDSIHGTIHSKAYNHIKGTQKGKAIFIKNPYTESNIYAIEWTPEKIDFLVNNVVYNSFKNEHLSTAEWPFDQPFYLILNLAIGGNWGGKMGVDDAIFPATMEVDYVRIFEKNK